MSSSPDGDVMHACSRLSSPARSLGSLSPRPRTLPDGIGERLLGEAALSTYSAVGRLAEPAARLFLRARQRRGLEDATRLGERFGRAGRLRQPGPLIWVHASSIGETSAALALVNKLAARGSSLVLTTSAVAGFQIAERHLPEGAVHQFAPIDTPRPVDRFLDHWRPGLALFAESELWPTMLNRLHRRGVPLVLVSARMSEPTFRSWRRSGPIARALLRKLGLTLAQSEADAERYRNLGAAPVQVCGNLKFDVPPPSVDGESLRAARAATGNRQVLLAASTHPGEEGAVLAAHAALAGSNAKLLTIIAPRHARRGGALAEETARAGLSVSVRSQGQRITPDTDVYVADTVGEMGLWYRVAEVAFLGGSLAPHGGQNPIEPAQLGVPVLHGPHVENFGAIYEALDRGGGAARVVDGASLAATTAALLTDPARRRRMAESARGCLPPFAGALERTIEALEPYLARLEAQRCA